MPNRSVHIIQKQCYDVSVPNEQYGRQLQQGLQQMDLNYIMPAISNKLDDLFAGDDVVVIDKLEINIGKLKSHAEPGEWVEKILAGLETSVRVMGIKKPENELQKLVTVSSHAHAIKVWLYFLETGMLPSETFFKTIEEVRQELFLLGKEERQLLKMQMLQQTVSLNAFQRLTILDKATLLFFIALLMPSIPAVDWNYLQEYIAGKIAAAIKQQTLPTTETRLNVKNKMTVALLQQIWHAGKENKSISANELEKIAEAEWEALLQPNIHQQEVTERNNAEKRKDNDPQNEVEESAEKHLSSQAIFVNNAGLCLLAPYLGMFFKAMQITDGNQFFSKASQQHAIYLVHHLATALLDAPEEQLVFAKLLCGWPLQMPCTNEQPISEDEIKEATELLVSIVSHWPVLKNTSPGGLREGFLQRGGKLVVYEDRYLLQVEQQSIDVLLDSVPWSFRMIKLPWMKRVLEVEWF